MKIAIIGAGKWGQADCLGRMMSKAHHTTLSLRPLWQSARATGCTIRVPVLHRSVSGEIR